MKYLKGMVFLAVALSSCLWGGNVQKSSIIHFAKKRPYTLRGEDGVLEEVFRRLKIENGFFVQVGAGNGVSNSRVRKLFQKGWRGALVEEDAGKFTVMNINYRKADKNKLRLFNLRIKGADEEGNGLTFDDFADKYMPTQMIDVLCISTMGNEHLILESLQRKPKVLCVLGGFSWHPQFDKRVPDEIALKNLQQPLKVMCQIAKLKGYKPICFTESTIFVRKGFASLFSGYNTDPVSLWEDAWNFTDQRHRDWIASFREHNTDIRTTEGPEFQELSF